MTENVSYGDTPATSPDPETVAEGDSNQLTLDETILDRDVDDILDEGYSPPDRPSRFLQVTELEQELGDSLDDRLAQEEPEVRDAPDGFYDDTRAGRLAAEEASVDGSYSNSVFAHDEGIAGSAASAEEAAMHVVDE